MRMSMTGSNESEPTPTKLDLDDLDHGRVTFGMRIRKYRGKLLTFRVYYAASIWIAYFAFGAGCTIFSPCWYDLTKWLAVSDAAMGYVKALSSIAYCLGTLTNGYLYGYVSRDVGMVFHLLILGVIVVIVPYITSFAWFVVAYGVIQFVGGGIDLACNVTTSSMFVKHLSTLLQLLHICFALGLLVSSAASEHFLAPESSSYIEMVANGSYTPVRVPIEYSPGEYPTRIGMPFAIVGGLTILATINMTFALFLRFSKERALAHGNKQLTSGSSNIEPNEKKTIDCSESVSARIYRSRGWKMWGIFWSCLALGAYTGLECSTMGYLINYLIGIGVPKATAAHMNTIVNVLYNVFRVVALFVTMKVPVKYILTISLTTCLSGCILMTVLGQGDVKIAWVACCLMGCGFSVNYPAIYAFINERLTVTNSIGGWMLATTGACTALGPVVIGNYLTDMPNIIMYTNFVAFAAVYLSLIVLDRSRLEVEPLDPLAAQRERRVSEFHHGGIAVFGSTPRPSVASLGAIGLFVISEGSTADTNDPASRKHNHSSLNYVMRA